MADLVQTPNGTFVTAEQAEAAGLEIPKPKRANKTAEERKPAARVTKTATTRKGKA